MNKEFRQKSILFGIVALIILLAFANQWWFGKLHSPSCNVAVVPLVGDIVAYDGIADASSTTSGDDVVRAIQAAEQHVNIRGIMLRIDSYGGNGAAAEQIMNTLKNSSLPTVALIRSAGTSAAYLAATGADQIIASGYADVGSIGVTESYVENVAQNSQQGLDYVVISSGPYKDSGNPNKPLTDAERALFERDVHTYADLFIQEVATNRNMATATVRALADGSTMPATLGVKAGLIDQIGDLETARLWFEKKIGGRVDFCE